MFDTKVPWGLGRLLMVRVGILAAISLALSGFGVFLFRKSLLNQALSLEALNIFDTAVASLIAFWLLVLVTVAGLFAFWFLMPLARVLRRASSIVDPKKSEEFANSDDPYFSEEGEWQDLELHLEAARREIAVQSARLRQEEAEIYGLIGAVPQPIVAIDRKSTVLFFNSHFADFAGIRKTVGKRLLIGELVRLPEILKAFETVLQTGEHHNVDFTVSTEDEVGLRYYKLSVAPLKLAQDETAQGAVGALVDVTELKRAEAVRIEFVGNVSHELRTPLTAIKGYAEVLEHDLKLTPGAEALSNFAERINRNTLRLRELVDDLLDLSSLESNVGLQFEKIDVREITERAIQQVQNRAREKKQDIVAYFDIETIEADPARLEQVLINLVDNATKYSPSEKRIEIHWMMKNGHPVLEVSDNGPGIAPVHRERLFERFYRVDESRSRDLGGGSGLGLSIVKHIMQRHGGSVTVESETDRGTKFICRFGTN